MIGLRLRHQREVDYLVVVEALDDDHVYPYRPQPTFCASSSPSQYLLRLSPRVIFLNLSRSSNQGLH
jgi:hypothetical protein